jgi:hypothetical protein
MIHDLRAGLLKAFCNEFFLFLLQAFCGTLACSDIFYVLLCSLMIDEVAWLKTRTGFSDLVLHIAGIKVQSIHIASPRDNRGGIIM